MLNKRILKEAINNGCSYAKIVTMDNHNITLNYEIEKSKCNESKIKTKSLEVTYLGGHGKITFTDSVNLDVENLIKIVKNIARLNKFKYKNLNNENILNIQPSLIKKKFIHSEKIKEWFYYEIEKIEKNMDLKLIFASYSIRNIYMELEDSNGIEDNQFISQDAVTLMKSMSDWYHKRDIGFNRDIYSDFKLYESHPTFISKNTQEQDLKGNVIFKSSCMNYILSNIIMIFSSRNIINKRSFINESMIGKNILKESISIIDDPNNELGIFKYKFDHEGTYTAKKRLVNKGKLNDLLNTVKTANILGGTPGNCFVEIDIPQLDISSTNIILDISEEINTSLEILIKSVNINKSSINIGEDHMTLYLNGYNINNKDVELEFILEIGIFEFLNKISPASKSYWNGNIQSPDIYIKI